MEYFVKFISYIEGLTKKQFQEYLLIFLCGVSVLAGGIMYVVYTKSGELLEEIKKVEMLTKKSITIIAEHQRIEYEERRVQGLFDLHKDFTIQSFFETFCREQGIKPEGDWAARLGDSNDYFDEYTISASFKNLTTEKLVHVLIEIEKKEIVYIKELVIKREKDKKINLDIVLATKSMKRGFDQRMV